MANARDTWLWPLAAVALVAAGIGLVGGFDLLGTHLPLSDEFFFRWSIERTVASGQLRLWPGALPLSLVQIAAALPVAALTPDAALLRLTVLPFVGLEAAFSWLLARRLGADRFWAGVAAALLPSAPIAMAVATGLMSDTAYVALLLGALYFGLRWVQEGRGLPACVAFAVLATLQRQHGVLIPVALTVAVLVGRRRPAPGMGDRARQRTPGAAGGPMSGVAAGAAPGMAGRGLAILWTGVLAALALPPLAGLRTETMAANVDPAILGRGLVNLFGALVTVPVVLGLFLIPLAVALLDRPNSGAERSRWDLPPVCVGVSALCAAAVFALHFGVMVFPGDVFGSWGLGQVHLAGDKPSAWPPGVFTILTLLALATTAMLLLWRRRDLRPTRLGPAGVLMVVAALTQAAPMFLTTGEDRYDLPVVAPLVPLLAAWASRPGRRLARPARAWALLAVVAGMVFYVRGEWDYQAWQVARDAAARQAYQTLAPNRVDAGFEAVGRYVAIPAVDATGRLPGGLRGMSLLAPDAVLELAPACDRRPGIGYGGPAPGKVVLVDLRGARPAGGC
ncbi:MAG TPA: hypothetical protein VG245_04465 [Candidatus Dormibacteraeota bacterium]|nr:hypothetical protein [Candidatus Dormibacteraeota bacterium]